MRQPTAGITRRAALLAGAGGLAAAGAAVVGLDWYNDRLPDGVPHDHPGKLISGSFVSARRGGIRTGWSVAYPPGHRPGTRLPVLVVLHGRGGDHRVAFSGLHLDRYLARAVRRGSAPFAIAAVDGGDHGYWHPRRGGDPAGMVIDEFLPRLAALGLNVHKIALLGWSMGGYGALYLGTRLGSARVAALVAESPAVWQHSWQSAAGAFDDAADFDAHEVLGRLRLLAGIPLRIDCGAQDAFAPITRELRGRLEPPPAGGLEPGRHDEAFWRSQASAQLAFVAGHFAR